MNTTKSTKIDEVLGYTTKFSNWGTHPRKCIPSVEREQYIIYLSGLGLSQTSLRIHNRYVDEYLIFVRNKKLERLCFDEPAFNKYLTHFNGVSTISEKTKSVKLNVVKKWIAWVNRPKR